MGQITENGFTFDSAWIELNVGRFLDRRFSRDFRLKELEREIDMRITDRAVNWDSRPEAFEDARAKAHLSELKRVWDLLRSDPES